jgi:ABC-type nickel/cobalt efflux system permease component RcnA
MRKLRLLALLTVTLILSHLLAPLALAHPLGNFTLNHYAGLEVQPGMITLDYVLDMAEIPAFQEIATFDANRNGQPDAYEASNYHPARCQALAAQLSLRLNQQPAALQLHSSSIEFPPGAGGLPTLRLSCVFQTPLSEAAQKVQVAFDNQVEADRIGWREIVVTGRDVVLQGDLTGLGHNLSQRLTAYPQDLLFNPLNQRHVVFTVISANSPVLSTQTPAEAQLSNQAAFDRNDGFTKLITLEQLTPLSLLLALAISFGWGAAHALTPGHGKTVVAAYLVGSRGTSRHALFLGLTTTITHTAGVFALGLLTLFASQFILPERLYPWLGVASGVLVVTIGWSLLRARLQHLLQAINHKHHHEHDHEHAHHHHDDHSHPHVHDHDHAHAYLHPHSHSHGFGHSHLLPDAGGSPLTWRSLLALGVSGGLIPCPSALVVMLSAIALDRVGFGLLLIVAFSMGLAGVLTCIGLLWVHAGRLFERVPISGRFTTAVPVLSALFVTVVGLGITLQAMAQIGLLPSQVMALTTMIAK